MNHTLSIIFGNWLVVGILAIGVVSVVDTIAKQIRKYASHRQDVDFKREMVERGLEIDEIERLVRAAPKSGGDSSKCC